MALGGDGELAGPQAAVWANRSMAKVQKQEQIGFEEAVGKLEELVLKMESGELPLEGILATYEEGMRLVAFCEGRLKAAEQKIELLTRDKSGSLTRSELAGELAETEAESDEETDGEASLF